MLNRVRLLVATLWAGSLWTIGFIVAPTLFGTLSDRVLAGNIAGSMFRAEAWLSIACALVLLALLQWGAGRAGAEAPAPAGRAGAVHAGVRAAQPFRHLAPDG